MDASGAQSSAKLAGHHAGGLITKRPPKCVLCIGNDVVSLNLRCTRLTEHGWHVVSSASGHDGLLRFGQEPADAVVLDLNDDGAEAALIAAQLKHQKPGVPVVMIVKDRGSLLPGASEQADAVMLKSEEDIVLPGVLKQLLRSV